MALPETPSVPDLTPVEGEDWLVCHTRPRCEKKFAQLMRAEGNAFFLPLFTSIKRYQQQTKKFTKPLFPGYVFARVHPEKKPRIYQLDLLARTISVEDERRFLAQLNDVQTIIAAGLEISAHPLLEKGTKVRIAGGALHGLTGIVNDPSKPEGIVLAVDVLQQGLLVKIPIEQLEPVVE